MIIDSKLFFDDENDFVNVYDQIIFICKSNRVPFLPFHLNELRTLSFDLKAPLDQFPDFLCNLISNYLSERIIIHPDLVQNIVQNYQNYYFLLEDNKNKIQKYLELLIFENKQEHFKMNLDGCKEDYNFDIKWEYLIQLIDFLKDICGEFKDNKLFGMELYYNKFQFHNYTMKSNPIQDYSKISYYFTRKPNQEHFETLILNNPILKDLRHFLKESTKKLYIKKKEILENFLERLDLSIDDNSMMKKLHNTQRTQDSFKCSTSMNNNEAYEEFVFIDLFENITEMRPNNRKQYLSVHMKVD
jgi:hypothetical protein